MSIKHPLKTSIFVFLLIMISACKHDIKHISITDFDIGTDSVVEIDRAYELTIRYPVFKGDEYRELNAAIKSFIPDPDSAKKEYIEEFQNLISEFPDAVNAPNILFTDHVIYANKDSILGVVFFIYRYYTGAAHGSEITKILNFDLKTDRKISYLSKVDDLAKFKETVLKEVNREVEKMDDGCWGIADLNEMENYFDHFVVTDTSMVFYFNDYSLCPYSYGNPAVSLSFENLPELRLLSE